MFKIILLIATTLFSFQLKPMLEDVNEEQMNREHSCIIENDAYDIMQNLWSNAHAGDEVSAKAYETFLAVTKKQIPSFGSDPAVIKLLVMSKLYFVDQTPDPKKMDELKNSPLFLTDKKAVEVLLESKKFKNKESK